MTTLASESQVARLEIDSSEVPRSIRVRMSLDDGRSWDFVEPGWRELSFGAYDGKVYWWSARRLVVVPNSNERLEQRATDHDILVAFRTSAGWLLVLETSVVLFDAADEPQSVEFGHVLTRASWNAPELTLTDESASVTRIRVDENGLGADRFLASE